MHAMQADVAKTGTAARAPGGVRAARHVLQLFPGQLPCDVGRASARQPLPLCCTQHMGCPAQELLLINPKACREMPQVACMDARAWTCVAAMMQ